MSGLLQNLSFGWRLLRKSPGFTLVAVLTLALGIGANTAIFSVVYATLLAPLPYPKPDQLVMVWSKVQGFRNGISAGDFLDWKRQSTSFQDLNAWTGESFNVASKDRPEQIQGQVTTPGFYNMMGVKFVLGRDFLPEEGQVGKDHEVVLTNSYWQRLGSDQEIIGKSLRVNGEPYTVVGVMAPGPTDRLQTEMVAPLAFKPEQINHDFHWILAMGRLKPGVSIAAAQADMDVVAARIAKDYPQSNKGWGASVEPLKNDFFPKEQQRTLWLLMGAVGIRVADRLRQRCQSPAGQSHYTDERSCPAFLARRNPLEDVQPVPYRELGVGISRRHRWHRLERSHAESADGCHAAVYSAIRSGRAAEPACPLLYPGIDHARGNRVRVRPCVEGFRRKPE